MNKRVKKVNMLAVAALLITGTAVGKSGPAFQTPTHYNTAVGLATPVWTAIPAGKFVDCDANPPRLCTARLVNGNFVSTDERGEAELIDVN